jgi:hypothetical protein
VRTLKTELEVLQVKESETICDLAWKVRRILVTIHFLRGEVDESSLIANILMMVPSRFRDTVAAMDQATTMTEVIERLQVHEEVICHRLLQEANPFKTNDSELMVAVHEDICFTNISTE